MDSNQHRPKARLSLRSNTTVPYGSMSSEQPDSDAPSVQITSISQRRSYIAVAVLCYINLLNYMDRYTIAGVLLSIQNYFSISDSTSGLLQTGNPCVKKTVSLVYSAKLTGHLLNPGYLAPSSLLKDGRPIKEYVREFLEISHQLTWTEDILKNVFELGLDAPLYQPTSAATPGSFAQYLDQVLLLNGSAFTVGEAGNDTATQPPSLLVPCSPEPSPLVPSSPEPSPHVLPAEPAHHVWLFVLLLSPLPITILFTGQSCSAVAVPVCVTHITLDVSGVFGVAIVTLEL